MSRDSVEQGCVVLVFGPTGTAGAGVVRACLDHPSVSEVRAVTRRPLGVSHAKLREVLCSDFADTAGIAGHFERVDCCLFCLGTSVRNVTGEHQYREIHVTYALAAARTLQHRSPDASFVYLSGAGASRGSRMMWARVKAEAEDKLAELKLAHHVNVRPAAILPMYPTGAARWLLAPLLNVLPAMGIHSVELGQAMLLLALDRSGGGTRTLENREIKAILASADPPREHGS